MGWERFRGMYENVERTTACRVGLAEMIGRDEEVCSAEHGAVGDVDDTERIESGGVEMMEEEPRTSDDERTEASSDEGVESTMPDYETPVPPPFPPTVANIYPIHEADPPQWLLEEFFSIGEDYERKLVVARDETDALRHQQAGMKRQHKSERDAAADRYVTQSRQLDTCQAELD